jgi:hypothetical protein
MNGMTKKLNVKQSDFCLCYLLTGNASQAYRIAYNAEKMKTEDHSPKSHRTDAARPGIGTYTGTADTITGKLGNH